jgi:molybdopterin/thiamine biosynthesis adenylyltransferase
MLNERYSRQIILPEIGESGQKVLLRSSALVVGCGGLGSTLLYCLCGMGVGRIGFCDGDVVSRGNLNRQFLHTPRDIGRKKTLSAHEKLKAFAPELVLEPMPFNLTDENAEAIISGYDVVVLAVDSIPARLIANRACVPARIPLIDGGVNGMHGTLFTFTPDETACLHCLFGDTTSSDEAIPSFAPVVSIVSAMEAQSVANVLLKNPNPSDGTMLLLDGMSLTIEKIPVSKRGDCPVCGTTQVS